MKEKINRNPKIVPQAQALLFKIHQKEDVI